MSLVSKDQDQNKDYNSMYNVPPLVPQIQIATKPKGASLYEQIKEEESLRQKEEEAQPSQRAN